MTKENTGNGSLRALLFPSPPSPAPAPARPAGSAPSVRGCLPARGGTAAGRPLSYPLRLPRDPVVKCSRKFLVVGPYEEGKGGGGRGGGGDRGGVTRRGRGRGRGGGSEVDLPLIQMSGMYVSPATYPPGPQGYAPGAPPGPFDPRTPMMLGPYDASTYNAAAHGNLGGLTPFGPGQFSAYPPGTYGGSGRFVPPPPPPPPVSFELFKQPNSGLPTYPADNYVNCTTVVVGDGTTNVFYTLKQAGELRRLHPNSSATPASSRVSFLSEIASTWNDKANMTTKLALGMRLSDTKVSTSI